MEQALAQILAEVKSKRETLLRDLNAALVAEGIVATCSKKCSACCYWPFGTSVLEGALVLEHAIRERKWTTTRRIAVRQAADMMTGLSYTVWLHSHIACPFLEDDLCSVYKARPLACRTAITSLDPAGCLENGFLNTLRNTEILMDFHVFEEKVLRRAGLQLYTMPLATAVLVAHQIFEIGLDRADIAILSEHQGRL